MRGRLRDPNRVGSYLLFDFFVYELSCLKDAFGLRSNFFLGGSSRLVCRERGPYCLFLVS